IVRGMIALAVVVCAVLIALNQRLDALRHVAICNRPVDEAVIPSPTATRLLSLGHNEWAADLLWIRALLYFGDAVASRGTQRFVQPYARTMQQVDPHFREAFMWAATVSMYNGRAIGRVSVMNAIENLERGIQTFPDDGEMMFQLGFDYFF